MLKLQLDGYVVDYSNSYRGFNFKLPRNQYPKYPWINNCPDEPRGDKSYTDLNLFCDKMDSFVEKGIVKKPFITGYGYEYGPQDPMLVWTIFTGDYELLLKTCDKMGVGVVITYIDHYDFSLGAYQKWITPQTEIGEDTYKKYMLEWEKKLEKARIGREEYRKELLEKERIWKERSVIEKCTILFTDFLLKIPHYLFQIVLWILIGANETLRFLRIIK